jgi:hypothetical protein
VADLEADQDCGSPGLDPCSSAQAFDAAFTVASESRSGTVDEAEFLSLVALLKRGLVSGWFAKREHFRSQNAATSPLPAREAVAVFADDAQPVRSGFLRVSGGQGRLELQRFFAALDCDRDGFCTPRDLALWLRAAGSLGNATGAASGSSGPGRTAGRLSRRRRQRAAGEGSAAEDGDVTMVGDTVDDDDDDDDDDDAWHGMVSAADVDSLFRPDLPDFSRKPRIAPGPSDAPRRKASRRHSGDGVGASSQAFVAARTPRSLPLSGDGASLGGAHEAALFGEGSGSDDSAESCDESCDEAEVSGSAKHASLIGACQEAAPRASTGGSALHAAGLAASLARRPLLAARLHAVCRLSRGQHAAAVAEAARAECRAGRGSGKGKGNSSGSGGGGDPAEQELECALAEAEAEIANAGGSSAVAAALAAAACRRELASLRSRGVAHALAALTLEAGLQCTLLRLREAEQYPRQLKLLAALPKLPAPYGAAPRAARPFSAAGPVGVLSKVGATSEDRSDNQTNLGSTNGDGRSNVDNHSLGPAELKPKKVPKKRVPRRPPARRPSFSNRLATSLAETAAGTAAAVPAAAAAARAAVGRVRGGHFQRLSVDQSPAAAGDFGVGLDGDGGSWDTVTPAQAQPSTHSPGPLKPKARKPKPKPKPRSAPAEAKAPTARKPPPAGRLASRLLGPSRASSQEAKWLDTQDCGDGAHADSGEGLLEALAAGHAEGRARSSSSSSSSSPSSSASPSSSESDSDDWRRRSRRGILSSGPGNPQRSTPRSVRFSEPKARGEMI